MNTRDASAALAVVGAMLIIGGLAGSSRRTRGRSSSLLSSRLDQPYVIDGVAYIRPTPSAGRTWAEWERSSTASARGIVNRVVSASHQRNIAYLSAFLDALEELAGSPLRITSGYRVPALNELLEGSAKDSRHTSGEAVDFSIPGMFGTSQSLAEFIYTTGLPFQKIGVYPGENRVHLQYTPISSPAENQRRYVYHSDTGDPISFRV